MRQLRKWKRLWRRSLTRSLKRTSMGPSRSCWNRIKYIKNFTVSYLVTSPVKWFVRETASCTSCTGITWLSPSISSSTIDFEFSFPHDKIKEPSLPYYLSIVGGTIVGYIHFPRLLALCWMQTASSRFWTWVAEFTFFHDNRCVKNASTSLRTNGLKSLLHWPSPLLYVWSHWVLQNDGLAKLLYVNLPESSKTITLLNHYM